MSVLAEPAAGAHLLQLLEELSSQARASVLRGCFAKLAAVETALLAAALEACDGNKSAAARMLGLGRKPIDRKYAEAVEVLRLLKEIGEQRRRGPQRAKGGAPEKVENISVTPANGGT
jgi:hypothetical protein